MGNDSAVAGALLQKLDELQATDDGGRLPRAFGPYHLLASLAKGGMGEVFLARSGAVVGFEKHCVVKTLRPHLTDDREYVARFIDEARVVVQLGHRNICQVFDVGRVGERYYLAMEQIAGKDLRSVLDSAGVPVVTAPMSRAAALPAAALDEHSRPTLFVDDALAVHIMGEVLEALDYAHRFVDVSGKALDLVHRDVSPQNVMVSFEGEVKLIDFGLAASTVKIEQTSPNVVMGKLAYMPPEQIRAEKLDRRADLFSAAVMLTEMITGERYYQGIGSYEVWTLAAQGDYRPTRFASIEPGLRAILDTALAGRAADRQESCAVLREELMAWRQKRGLYADGAPLRRLMHDRFADDLKAHRDLLAGVASRPHPVARADATDATDDGAAEGADEGASKSFARKRAPAALTVVEKTISSLDPTEPTVASTPRYRPQKSRLAAAGVGAAIAVVVAGIFSLVTSEPTATTTTPGMTPVTPPVTTTVATPATPEAPVTIPVTAPEPAVVVAPEVGLDLASPDPIDPSTAPKKKPPKKTPEKKLPEKNPEKPVEKVVVAPVVDQPAWGELGTTKKAEVLQRACPDVTCAQTLGKEADTWASKPLAGMAQYKRDLEACHRTCGKP